MKFATQAKALAAVAVIAALMLATRANSRRGEAVWIALGLAIGIALIGAIDSFVVDCMVAGGCHTLAWVVVASFTLTCVYTISHASNR